MKAITRDRLGRTKDDLDAIEKIILFNPEFYKALLEIQTRLRNGTAEWYTFEEVFDA